MSAAPARLPAPPPFEVWLVPLGADGSSTDEALLDEQERGRAARFVFERDRRRFVAAHASLRRLLGQRTGQAPHALRFDQGPYGKPRLRGSPGCAFSLSHSGDLALVALAADGEIGVDLEPVQPMRDAEALVRQCLSEREQLHLHALPASEQPLAFLQAWTRKEACLKAVGTGLQIEPSAVETGIDAAQRRVSIATPEGRREIAVSSLVPAPGWVAALARVSGRPKEGMTAADATLYSSR
jgi:4'-phosphopantetheinyl transferase